MRRRRFATYSKRTHSIDEEKEVCYRFMTTFLRRSSSALTGFSSLLAHGVPSLKHAFMHTYGVCVCVCVSWKHVSKQHWACTCASAGVCACTYMAKVSTESMLSERICEKWKISRVSVWEMSSEWVWNASCTLRWSRFCAHWNPVSLWTTRAQNADQRTHSIEHILQ